MTREEIYLEVLKIASQLIINQHTDKRADLHNQWVLESEELWRIRKLKLAYPPIPPYPSEQDVTACATNLLRFIEKKVDEGDITSDNKITEEHVDVAQITESSVTPSKKPSEEASTIFNRFKSVWKHEQN